MSKCEARVSIERNPNWGFRQCSREALPGSTYCRQHGKQASGEAVTIGEKIKALPQEQKDLLLSIERMARAGRPYCPARQGMGHVYYDGTVCHFCKESR